MAVWRSGQVWGISWKSLVWQMPTLPSTIGGMDFLTPQLGGFGHTTGFGEWNGTVREEALRALACIYWPLVLPSFAVSSMSPREVVAVATVLCHPVLE